MLKEADVDGGGGVTDELNFSSELELDERFEGAAEKLEKAD